MNNMIYLRKWGGLYQNMVNSRAQLLEGRLPLSKPRVKYGQILIPVRGDFFFCSKAFSRIIFSVFFRASDHQTVDNKNETELKNWLLRVHIWIQISH